MRPFSRILAAAGVLAMLAQGAQATTYYYYRGGAQGGQQTGTTPPSPAPAGVFAILIDTPQPNVAVVGNPYSATTYVYSNVGSVAFSIVSGALPSGISLNGATGTISGTPTLPGSVTATIRGQDTTSGKTATATLALDTVAPLSISGSPASTVVVGTSYSTVFTLAGGGQPYSFAATGLPPGLALSAGASSATLAGTATAPGTYDVVVTGTESHGLYAQFPFQLVVADTLAIAGLPPGTATVGLPYSGQVAVSGGAAPFSFSVAAGQLPNNITLKPATGVVSGTPTTAGTKSGIKIKVTDASGQSVTSGAFSIVVGASGNQTLTISGNPTTTGTTGTTYSTQWFAGGGTTPYSFSLAPGSGALPPGLSLNGPTGILSGAPSVGTQGVYPNIVVQVSDSAGTVVAAAPYTLTISPPASTLTISGNPPGNAQSGIPYAAQFSANGGTNAGYTFSSVGSALPPGLVIDAASGLLSGSPTANGTYTGLKIRVTDSGSHIATSATFSITVAAAAPLVISGNPSTSATMGQAYTASWTAFDGSGAGYHFTSVGAALPPGLSLSDANGVQGVLSGTPTVAGSYPGLQIEVRDSAGHVADSAAFTLTVASSLAIAGTPVDGGVGIPYSVRFTASGGSGTGYTFASVGAALPPGLALDAASGIISGTPTAAGVYPALKVQVSDSAGSQASAPTFVINVAPPPPPPQDPLAVLGNAPATASTGQPYIGQFSGSGGAPAYVYSIASGSLPPGLTLDPSSGAVTGQATALGHYGPIVVRVTDQASATALSQPFSIDVASDLSISGSPQDSIVALDQPYSAQFTAHGGSHAGYVYSMTGTLPPGIAMDAATGLLSGTATSPGVYTGLSARVVDSTGASASTGTFRITVQPSLTLTGNPPTSLVVGQSYLAQFGAYGGQAPYTFAASGLPSGLSIDTASGAISGVVATPGDYGIAVSLTDGTNTSRSTSYVLSVQPAQTAPLSASWAPQTFWRTGDFMAVAVTFSGGNGSAYTFSHTGTLPPGVAQDPSTGALYGTVSTAGNYGPIAITVSDGTTSATTAPATFTVSNYAPLTISWTPPSGPLNVGDWLYTNVTASGGDSSHYVFSYTGTLPPGTSFTWWSGNVCCSATNGGTFGPIVVTVTDGLQTVSTTPWTVTVNPPLPLRVGYDSPVRVGTVGANYSEGFWGIDGAKTGYSCALAPSSAALPPGLSQNGCSIQGVPTAAGSYPGIVMQVTDANGTQAASDPIAISVNPIAGLAIAWNNPPTVLHQGDFINITTTATGGLTTKYTFSLTGQLPPGLNFGGGGNMCCGISVPGTYGPFSVTVNDTLSTATTAPITFVVKEMELAATFPGGMAGSWYHASLQPLGGDGGNTFSCTGLPNGLTIAPWGSIDGPLAADAAGTYAPNCSTTDRNGHTASVAATFRVASTPPTISAVWVEGTVGTPFSYTPTTSGGLAPYTITVGGDPLPAGLSIDPATGTISGIPTAKGQANVVLYLTDAGGFQANTGHILIDIYQDGVISFPNKFTYDEMVNRAPWQSFDGQNGLFSGTSTGGAGGEGWAITNISAADAIKLGFSWAQDGQRIGFNGNFPSPTTAGTYAFDLVVRDNAHNQGHRHYSVTVWPEIKLDSAPPPNAIVNQPYSFQMKVTGGKPPLNCSGGTPAGLSVDPTTCVISGMTTSADSNFNRNFIAQDASGYYASTIWRLQSVPPPTTQDPGGTPPPANNVGHDATDWHPYVQTIDLRKLALTGEPYYPSVPSPSQAVALNAAFDAKDVAVCVNSGGVQYGSGWTSPSFSCSGSDYQQPNGLTYAIDANAGTLTIYGTPYDNVLPVSCGNGCQKFDVGYKDYVIPIFISTGSAGAISASATLRVWAWAPPPWNTSGLTASYTSTSQDPSCGGACDVSAVIRQGGATNGTVAGRDFVNLAVGDSITIQYRTLVQAFNVGLQMSCNMTLDTAGSATYRVDAWDGYSTDGNGQPVWQPFEYQWWGSDRILPGPQHVPFSQQACLDAESFSFPGPIDYASTQYPYDPNFMFGPWDHTTDYLTQGRPVLAVKLTRTGGTMPFWPVSSFYATGEAFLAAAP